MPLGPTLGFPGHTKGVLGVLFELDEPSFPVKSSYAPMLSPPLTIVHQKILHCVEKNWKTSCWSLHGILSGRNLSYIIKIHNM